MKNILLTVSYDGTDFCGWQRQDCGTVRNATRTVQGEIERALEKLLGQPVTLYGSGRTDSGVHALAQAANFYSPVDSIPEKNYIRALNSFLPGDIRIVDSCEKPEYFNARYNATSRTYRYFIFPGETMSAPQNRFVWTVPYQPSSARLNEMASFLRGEIDCASFAASGDKSLSTCRYIEGARFFTQSFFPDGREVLVFEIEANAFLWKMVRTLAGTLVSLDKAGADPSVFKEIIEARDRSQAGVTAPPHGLFLYKISFDGIRRHS